MSKRAWALAALAASIGVSAAVQAHYRSGDISVDVVDENGATFSQMPVKQESKLYRAYLQAERGARYRIRVTNRSGDRVGVVVAVDGRNIISGDRSDLERTEAMYILGPWATEEYSGWRSSLADVHEFYFTEWADSYAEAFGDRSARGVIAVAAYREKPQPPVYDRGLSRESEKRGNSDARPPEPPAVASGEAAASAQDAEKPRSEPGTGYGDRRDEPAVRVAFEAEPRARARVFLKYEWRETLCRKGIVDCREPDNRFWPDTLSFAPPPPRAAGHQK